MGCSSCSLAKESLSEINVECNEIQQIDSTIAPYQKACNKMETSKDGIQIQDIEKIILELNPQAYQPDFVEKLIQLKKDYKLRIIFLKNNQEQNIQNEEQEIEDLRYSSDTQNELKN